MPGLAGFIIGKMRVPPKDIIRKMQNSITYSGEYVRDKLFCDDNVCATRSHINVIQKQPQPYSESGVYVWLDGEFYNQETINSEFDIQPGCSDPEILLRLYTKSNDLSFLKLIDGFYAGVIYDSKKKQVHIISDRYGLRHIYWTVYEGNLCWGSEVKVVLALPSFKAQISRGAVEEFFKVGYLLENRTWFEGVELLASGTVLTWDIREKRAYSQRYWWWDEIKPLSEKIEESELAEELGRLFTEAVEIRSRAGEQVGIGVSGGLDSRGLLAAMPYRGYPINTFTFGTADCEDVRIASLAVKVKGASHHIIKLENLNWLMPRLAGVWWTDGQLNLMHMHGIEARDVIKNLFQINLSGFAGDLILGGSFLNNENLNKSDKELVAKTIGCDTDLIKDFDKYSTLTKSDFYFLQNRVRRFTFGGLKHCLTSVEQREPFYDNKLIEFIYSLKDEFRFQSRIYKKMLMYAFPNFYRTIPWQKTGLPVWSPDLLIKGRKQLFRGMRRIGFKSMYRYNFTNYPDWIRQEPNVSFFNKMFKNANALYTEFIPRAQVIGQWEKHMQGLDRSEILCRYLTFEIWLQQVFEGKYRSSDEGIDL